MAGRAYNRGRGTQRTGAGAQHPLSEREPIFNVPFVVVGLIGICLAVHIGRSVLPDEQNAWATAVLAFIPARFGDLAGQLPGGQPARYTSLVTHIFVHGDLTHLAINSAWLLAFGTPVARRTDWLRFLAFFFLTGIAGALFYYVVNGPIMSLLVGASGAISGLMGAAFRFLFRSLGQSPGGFDSATRHAPLMTLGETLRDRRVVSAAAIWTVLNMVLAWGAAGLTQSAGIAWEAHLGGFYVGLLTYGWFDHPPPPAIAETPLEDAAGAE
jgi:membrane associated rhomboid family serine protease